MPVAAERVLHIIPSIWSDSSGSIPAVVLPVGIRDKADRCVERQPRLNSAKVLRVERQDTLYRWSK